MTYSGVKEPLLSLYVVKLCGRKSSDEETFFKQLSANAILGNEGTGMRSQ